MKLMVISKNVKISSKNKLNPKKVVIIINITQPKANENIAHNTLSLQHS